MSPVKIEVEKDESIKVLLESKKLNGATTKRKAQMPYLEKLLSRISRKLSEEKDGDILILEL